MKRKIHLELEFEDDEYDALLDEANFRLMKTVEEYLELIIQDQAYCSMINFEAGLSEEELREFRNDYGDEDWIDELDEEIPF